jgi:coproporphyrinogen III oxidase
VESKATIQPFVTEGSNGSYKRGAYRGNRNKKKSLQGSIAELSKTVNQYEEEARSQQSRQLIRYVGYNASYKRGAYRGNINEKNSLQGNISELGNNVYQYRYRKTNPKKG